MHTAFLKALAFTLPLAASLVSASQPNQGFAVSLDPTTIQAYIESSYGDQTALAGLGYRYPYLSSYSNFTFTVPITVTRLNSYQDDLTLSLFVRPYDYDLDQAPAPIQVYREPISMSDAQEGIDVTFNATFTISTENTDTTVFYLSAQLDIPVTPLEGFRSAVPGAAVLNYDPETGLWTPMTPAVYATEVNEAIHAQYEAVLALVTEPTIDTSGSLVICGQAPDLPEENTKNNRPSSAIKEGEASSSSSQSSDTSSSCSIDGNEKPHDSKGKDNQGSPPSHTLHCRNNDCKEEVIEKTKTLHCRNNDCKEKVIETPKTLHCRNNDCKDKVIEKPKTIHCRNNDCKDKDKDSDKDDPHYPDWNILKPPCNSSAQSSLSSSPSVPPSTSPKPCPPAGVRNALLQARQTITTPWNGFGMIRLTLNYGTAARPVPIRQLAVEAFGTIGGRVQRARGTTDDNGFVILAWSLQAGQVIDVSEISVSLDAEKFRISTSKDNGASFLYWRAVSIPLEWQVVGNTISDQNYRFMNKATNDLFNVQDRILNSWVFAKTKVYNFDAKLPNVWFPGDARPKAGNYFANSGNDISRAYISINPNHATYTTAIAHEYGHWFHYLARGTAPINYKTKAPEHHFCEAGNPNSDVVSLTEGYATAFGLSSLWQSRFQENAGTGYCWFPADLPLGIPPCQEIEKYDCDAIAVEDRNLSTDEGRVAAALRDLIDAAGDDNGDDDGRGVSGIFESVNDFYSRVLLDPMRNNPSNMSEYWNNFKASPGLNQAQIDAAWDVLEYQYAKFSK